MKPHSCGDDSPGFNNSYLKNERRLKHAAIYSVPGCFDRLALCFRRQNTGSAAEIHGRSSTQAIWYNDIVDNSKQLDLAQYLRVSASSLDSDNKLSVNGYGRAVYNTKDNSISEGKEVNTRLYYFFADYKDFMGNTDIRLGRQFVNLSAGSTLMDGLKTNIKNAGPVGFVLMGGRNVIFGEEGNLTSHSYTVGAAAYLSGVKNTDLDVSYFRAYDYSEIARDILGASFKQYLADSVKVYANARYDLTAEVFNEVLAGLNYFPILSLMLTAEHFESYPTFDTTSIYSVFAVNKYKENVLRAEYSASQWLGISAAYSAEDFGDGEDATLYEIGFKIRPSLNTTIGIFHDNRSGYGGDLDGYKVYAEYRRFGKWNAAAGIDYDSYQRDDMTGQETAKKYWAAGRYIFTKNMSSSFRVEDNVNVNYSKDIQGRLTFDYDF